MKHGLALLLSASGAHHLQRQALDRIKLAFKLPISSSQLRIYQRSICASFFQYTLYLYRLFLSISKCTRGTFVHLHNPFLSSYLPTYLLASFSLSALSPKRSVKLYLLFLSLCLPVYIYPFVCLSLSFCFYILASPCTFFNHASEIFSPTHKVHSGKYFIFYPFVKLTKNSLQHSETFSD